MEDRARNQNHDGRNAPSHSYQTTNMGSKVQASQSYLGRGGKVETSRLQTYKPSRLDLDQYLPPSGRLTPLPELTRAPRPLQKSNANPDATRQVPGIDGLQGNAYADIYDLAMLLDIKNGHATFPISRPSSTEKFSIFDAFLQHADLLLTLAAHISIPDLLTLYSISRPFHFHFNLHYATYVLQAARTQTPESYRIFPFRQYGDLQIKDPAGREDLERPDQIRTNPSLRWLQMLHFREKATNEILVRLAINGHRLPSRTSAVIKKIWLLMDMPTTATRVGLMHNRKLWTDDDLKLASMFFVKLDMRFSHPVHGSGDVALRELLLAQRGLSLLYKTLRGEALVCKLEVLQQYVRSCYKVPKDKPELHKYSVMGVPPKEIGMLGFEFWGKTGSKVKLMRPDQLVAAEGVRRGLQLSRKMLGFMMYGFVNPRTGKNVEVNIPKQMKKLKI